MIGPLGKAFAHPKRLTNCLLVAEGHGAASLYFLAQELSRARKRVDMVIGRRTLERVFKPIEAKRLSQTVAIVTDDGTLGERGAVLDALPEAARAERRRGDVRGRRAARRCERSRRSAASAGSRRRWRVEERMGCGFGLCLTCVVPVARKDGSGYDNLARLRGRAGVQPGARPVGSVARRASRDAADAARGAPVVRAWPG